MFSISWELVQQLLPAVFWLTQYLVHYHPLLLGVRAEFEAHGESKQRRLDRGHRGEVTSGVVAAIEKLQLELRKIGNGTFTVL